MAKTEINEQDYIMVGDLASIRTLAGILRDDIVPAINPLIDREDYRLVYSIISKWEMQHYDAIKVTPDGD